MLVWKKFLSNKYKLFCQFDHLQLHTILSTFCYPRYPFDGSGLVLAHAYYPYEFDELGGDINFDEDEFWTINSTDSR